MSKNKQIYGFTIAELLIVIVVIGVLAAITVGAFNNMKNRAGTAKEQSDFSAVKKKVEMVKTLQVPVNSTNDASSAAQTDAAISTFGLESFKSQMMFGTPSGNCSSSPMTKEKYCVRTEGGYAGCALGGGYNYSTVTLVYWKDSTQEWTTRQITGHWNVTCVGIGLPKQEGVVESDIGGLGSGQFPVTPEEF